MNRIDWWFDSDEYIELPYETIHGEKTGMVIEILANPICIFYPLRLNEEAIDCCIETEVYL